jgi:hypothetical protein
MTVSLNTAELNTFADRLTAANVKPYSDDEKAITGDIGYDNLCAVRHVMHLRTIRANIEAFETTPAIKAALLANIEHDVRGVQAPKICDLHDTFTAAARRTNDQYGKKRAVYKPVGPCALTMNLKSAVVATYRQEAYSDDSVYYVPVTGKINADDKAAIANCNNNLNAFVRYADTHTGWAGSGCNWSAHLVVTDDGAYVEIGCRSSISD